jgi:hypothetical protein
MAQNNRGWSVYSDLNSVGVRVKSAPVSTTDPARNIKTDTKMIVVDWPAIEAPDDGNSPVVSYSLEYDQGTQMNEWIVLTGLSTEFTDLQSTVTDYITRGVTYVFRIRARNVWGWGPYGNYVAIQAARRPLPITGISSTITNNGDFLASWVPADDQGSPVTSYTVWVFNQQTSVFGSPSVQLST